MNPISAGLSADEDHGRTSEEEEGVSEQSYDRQVRYVRQRQMKAGSLILWATKLIQQINMMRRKRCKGPTECFIVFY